MLIVFGSKKTIHVTIWRLVSVGGFIYNVITMLMVFGSKKLPAILLEVGFYDGFTYNVITMLMFLGSKKATHVTFWKGC